MKDNWGVYIFVVIVVICVIILKFSIATSDWPFWVKYLLLK